LQPRARTINRLAWPSMGMGMGMGMVVTGLLPHFKGAVSLPVWGSARRHCNRGSYPGCRGRLGMVSRTQAAVMVATMVPVVP